ncbi:MAG: hypothetical protein ACK4MV_00330 [Beijerinckiaceae bacterium]
MLTNHLKHHAPFFARDVRKNLDILDRDQSFGAATKWCILLACANATQCGPLIDAVLDAAGDQLSQKHKKAADDAAAVMFLQSIQDRLTLIDEKREYLCILPRLATKALDRPSVDQVEFDMVCFAVLSMIGPVESMRNYEIVLRKRGVTKKQILALVQYAAIMKATAVSISSASARVMRRSDAKLAA